MARPEVGLVNLLGGRAVSSDQVVLCVLQGYRLLATQVAVVLVAAKAMVGNGLGPAGAMVVAAGRERVLAELASVVAMGAGQGKILVAVVSVGMVLAALAAVHRLDTPRTTTPECSLR